MNFPEFGDKAFLVTDCEDGLRNAARKYFPMSLQTFSTLEQIYKINRKKNALVFSKVLLSLETNTKN